MLIEESQRKEMHELADEILKATPASALGSVGYLEKTQRLAELVKAVTSYGFQGGKATLVMTCIKCERTFTSNEQHTCGDG